MGCLVVRTVLYKRTLGKRGSGRKTDLEDREPGELKEGRLTFYSVTFKKDRDRRRTQVVRPKNTYTIKPFSGIVPRSYKF